MSQPLLLQEFQEDEASYFVTFRDRTSRELSGYFESAVWNRLILQVCHAEPFARHCAVAIGALTKTNYATLGCHKFESWSPSARCHLNIALQQYGKSLELMRAIVQQNEETRFRNTLVSSLLTTCFESYVGNQESAISQGQAGVKVLAAYQHPHSLGNKGWCLDNDLFCTFARLDSQIIMFKDTRAVKDAGIVVQQTKDIGYVRPCLNDFFQSLPRTFNSRQIAREYWDLAVEAAMLSRSASHPHGFDSLDFGENNVRTTWRKTGELAQEM
jgi:hypothetical protein